MLFVLSCNHLGKQAPVTIELTALSDNKNLNYYSVFFCTGYLKKGTVPTPDGFTNYYLNVTDNNSKGVIGKPYKLKSKIKILSVQGDNLWYIENPDKNYSYVNLIDLKTLVENEKVNIRRFKIESLNQDSLCVLVSDNVSDINYMPSNSKIYCLTLSKQKVSSEIKIVSKKHNAISFEKVYSFESGKDSIYFEGDFAKKIVNRRVIDTVISSETLDYYGIFRKQNKKVNTLSNFYSDIYLIDPCFVKVDGVNNNEPLSYNNNLIVISKTSLFNNQCVVSLINREDLKEIKHFTEKSIFNPFEQNNLQSIELNGSTLNLNFSDRTSSINLEE
jgi:hypothetical protein